MVELEVKRWGNSFGVIIPIEQLKKIQVKQGDVINVDIQKKKRENGFGLARGSLAFEEEQEEHEEFW